MNLVERVKNILITPKTEWEVINGETATPMSLLMGYVLPLALIGAVCAFIGYGIIGVNTGLFGIRINGIDWGLYEAISRLLAALLGFIISAYVVDMLAPTFKSEKNINKSAQLVAYSATASFVGGIFLLLPSLAILALLCGLYGIYIMYLGIGPLKKTPEDQKVVYMIVAIVVYAVITGIILLILHKILASIFSIGLPSISLG